MCQQNLMSLILRALDIPTSLKNYHFIKFDVKKNKFFSDAGLFSPDFASFSALLLKYFLWLFLSVKAILKKPFFRFCIILLPTKNPFFVGRSFNKKCSFSWQKSYRLSSFSKVKILSNFSSLSPKILIHINFRIIKI